MMEFDLTEEELINTIEKYYDTFLDGLVGATKSMKLNDDHSDIELNFYIVLCDGYGETTEILLSREELTRVLNYYLIATNYEVDHFKYLGGIRRVGYFTDEDTPILEGIRIYAVEKGKKLVKKPDLNY